MTIFNGERYTHQELKNRFNELKLERHRSGDTHMVLVNYTEHDANVIQSDEHVYSGCISEDQLRDASYLMSQFNISWKLLEHQQIDAIYDLNAACFEEASIDFARPEVK